MDPKLLPVVYLVVYLAAFAVTVVLIDVLRRVFLQRSKLSVPMRRAYLYGFWYSRQVGMLASIGGFLGTIFAYRLGVLAHWSLVGAVVLPLLYHVLTTRVSRYEKSTRVWRT